MRISQTNRKIVRLSCKTTSPGFVFVFFAILIVVSICQTAVFGFSIGTNFTGPTFSEARFVPPDTMGGVGPDHIAVLINGYFEVFDRVGVSQMSKSLNDFFIDAGVTPAGAFAFDPRILYDKFSERWFATAVDNQRGPNNILFAVSSSSDPSGDWTAFSVDSDSTDQTWADLPMMGINSEVVVITATMPSLTSGRRTTNALILPKSDLLTSNPSIAHATFIEDSLIPIAAQPVVDLDNGNLPLTMLSDGVTSFQTKLHWRYQISGTPNAPDVELAFAVPTTFRVGTTPVDQPGTKADVHAGDTRIFSNVVGQNGSEWAVHGVDEAGRAAIEWFEIDQVTGTPLQQGIISDSSLGLNFASIAVNDMGDVVIGFSGGGPNTFMSSYAVVGTTTAGVTHFGPITQLTAGLSDYERLDDRDRNRWGDYSATVIDPLDSNRFWTFQEFVVAEDEWAIQVTEIVVPEPSAMLLFFFGLALTWRVGFYVRVGGRCETEDR